LENDIKPDVVLPGAKREDERGEKEKQSWKKKNG